MRRVLIPSGTMLVAAGALVACRPEQTASLTGTGSSSSFGSLTVPSGSSIEITLGTALTSETARVGNYWSGTTRSAWVLDGRNVIPVGSSVRGTITGVTPARKDDRAMLDLGLTSFTVGDRDYSVRGTMESVIGGLIGAGAAAGVVSQTKGYQVVLKQGTPVTFTTREAVVVRIWLSCAPPN